jgi:peptide deformylase
MSYQDLSGVEKVEEADGLLSVCLQHEVDQLDGIFWISRLSRLKRGIMAQLPQEFSWAALISAPWQKSEQSRPFAQSERKS